VTRLVDPTLVGAPPCYPTPPAVGADGRWSLEGKTQAGGRRMLAWPATRCAEGDTADQPR